MFQTLTGTVQNITFTDLKVEIYKYRDGLVSLYVGGVCAELKNGTIENCHINGSSSIKGDHYREVEGGDPVNTSVGGFVGKLLSGGNIINCSIDSGSVYSKADCGKHNGNCQAYAGGMVGYQETNSLIENCSRNDGVSVNSVVRGDPSTWWGKSGHLYAYSGGIVGCYNPAATWGEIEIPATRTNCDSTATNVSAQKSQESGWCTDRIYLYKGAIGNAPKLL